MMKPEQTTLFPTADLQPTTGTRQGKTSERLKRVDTDPELRELLIPYCRLNRGEIWQDGVTGTGLVFLMRRIRRISIASWAARRRV